MGQSSAEILEFGRLKRRPGIDFTGFLGKRQRELRLGKLERGVDPTTVAVIARHGRRLPLRPALKTSLYGGSEQSLYLAVAQFCAPTRVDDLILWMVTFVSGWKGGQVRCGPMPASPFLSPAAAISDRISGVSGRFAKLERRHPIAHPYPSNS